MANRICLMTESIYMDHMMRQTENLIVQEIMCVGALLKMT